MSASEKYQRVHIEKVVKDGTKKTTISIETLTYEFLCIQLNVEPYTRESHQTIREWITKKMESDPVYDSQAPYLFSAWLKKTILREIVSHPILKEWEKRIGA